MAMRRNSTVSKDIMHGKSAASTASGTVTESDDSIRNMAEHQRTGSTKQLLSKRILCSSLPPSSLITTSKAEITTSLMASAVSHGGSVASPILFKGIQVINDDAMFVCDVLVQDTVIQQVSASVEAPSGALIVDGKGKVLMPAGIDVRTHISSSNSAEEFEISSKAAVMGGTATYQKFGFLIHLEKLF
ncbi:unnamed protein product [Thelazia callipaeda]|uniref:Amidohydro-rel domain-containing protein n=1 Tax=Thelazia callipaeda TaxID=103827 RepID=A0A0N5CTW6_THECL|nr:unnamed protein product [Thelazia callipaeda]